MATDTKRDLIIQAASEIIQEQGLEALTMRALALKLEISRPALYQYVASREHVLSEILLDEMADLSNELDRLLRDLKDPMEQIRVWLHFSLAFMASDRHRFVSDIPQGVIPEDQRGMFRAMHGFYTSSLISPLAEVGVEDPATTANLILGLIGATAKKIELGADFSAQAKALEDFVMAGIEAALSNLAD